MTGAIRQAAQATGTRFQYLLASAQVESGLDPQAGAATSSARGLFQFAEQTWPGTMKQSGAALGHGRYADAITKTTSGRYEVADPAMRREILKVRTDPMVNAVMAGAFTQANAALLSQKLGRGPSEGGALPRAFSRRRRRGAPDFACADNPRASAAATFSLRATMSWRAGQRCRRRPRKLHRTRVSLRRRAFVPRPSALPMRPTVPPSIRFTRFRFSPLPGARTRIAPSSRIRRTVAPAPPRRAQPDRRWDRRPARPRGAVSCGGVITS